MKQPLTLCGIRPRAWVISHAGAAFTYEWPCGYTKTETLLDRVTKKPVGDFAAAFYAKYWRQGQGVTYECPQCRRKAKKER